MMYPCPAACTPGRAAVFYPHCPSIKRKAALRSLAPFNTCGERTAAAAKVLEEPAMEPPVCERERPSFAPQGVGHGRQKSGVGRKSMPSAPSNAWTRMPAWSRSSVGWPWV